MLCYCSQHRMVCLLCTPGPCCSGRGDSDDTEHLEDSTHAGSDANIILPGVEFARERACSFYEKT